MPEVTQEDIQLAERMNRALALDRAKLRAAGLGKVSDIMLRRPPVTPEWVADLRENFEMPDAQRERLRRVFYPVANDDGY